MTRQTFRPLDQWPREQTRHRERSRFGASLSDTYVLLDRETNMIDAREVVIALDIREADIRISDGKVKANIRPDTPRVAVHIERRDGWAGGHATVRPPLAFYADRYVDWQDNLRAIALGLEALRKVDRYGITSGGEQYAGWTAIPAESASRGQALDTISVVSRMTLGSHPSEDDVRKAVRRALLLAHPDHGGSRETLERVQAARQILNA